MVKITELPARGQRDRAGEVNRSSGGGESPPDLRIWHIPAQVASVNAVGARHGKEWTSRQLIPEGEVVQSSGRGNDCKVYFAEGRSSAELPAGVTPSKTGNKVPEYLRCMFPAEGTLTPR